MMRLCIGKKTFSKFPQASLERLFVEEFSQMFRAYTDGSALEGIAMKAAMVSRYSELRDITTELMSEVCPSVGTEPSLQLVTDKHVVHRTANREDCAQLVAAESFWGGSN